MTPGAQTLRPTRKTAPAHTPARLTTRAQACWRGGRGLVAAGPFRELAAAAPAASSRRLDSVTAGRPIPPPRTAPAATAGARWEHRRCTACGSWTAQPVPLRSHGCTEGLTAPPSTCIHGTAHLDVGVRAWYDGATAGRAAGATGGAAAVIRRIGGEPAEHITRRLPADIDSLHAECEVCVLVCEALVLTVDGPRTAVAYGDNAQVVRHAQGAGRLRIPTLAARLDQSLARLYAAGWHVSWVLIHRDANGDAHALARRTARVGEAA